MTQPESTAAAPVARILTVGTKLSFGVGQMAEAMKNAGFGIFVLFYYNQVLGLSGTWTSLALGIAVLCDAITDPIAGSLSDKLHSRWGRRHPFIFASAFPLAVTFFFLFSPPPELSQLGLFTWLLVFAVLVRTAMTAYHIPHLALGAEMAHDYDDRSSVFAYSTTLGFFGAIATSFIGYTYFFPPTEGFANGLLNPAGYPRFAAFLGVGMIVTIMICVFGTRKEIPYLPVPLEKPPPFGLVNLVRELAVVFRSRSFLAIFFGMMMGTLVLSIEGVFSAYMGVHFWGFETDLLRWLPIGLIAGLPFSFFLTPLFTRWFDKRNSIILCAAIAIVNANVAVCLRLFDVSWFPSNGSTPLMIILISVGFIGGSIAPIIFTSINSIFADIADEFELHIGQRIEGLIYSARAFALKATSAFGLIIGGIVLDLIAFPTNAVPGEVDPDVIFRLGVAQGPATSIFTLLSLLLYMQYKLNRKKHAEIATQLAARRVAAAQAAAETGTAAG